MRWTDHAPEYVAFTLNFSDADGNRKWNQRCDTIKCPLSVAQVIAVLQLCHQMAPENLKKVTHWEFKSSIWAAFHPFIMSVIHPSIKQSGFGTIHQSIMLYRYLFIKLFIYQAHLLYYLTVLPSIQIVLIFFFIHHLMLFLWLIHTRQSFPSSDNHSPSLHLYLLDYTVNQASSF